MTYTEWVEYVEKVRKDYMEGYITVEEYHRAVYIAASEVIVTE